MPSEEQTEPVTAKQAGDRLEKAAATIRCWVGRYGARQLKKVGKVVYYDYLDLTVIDRELKHGHTVPRTWQERAEIAARCPLRDAERAAEQFRAA